MIRVVLCRPLGPRNVGSVLRSLVNFGPAELWLTAPRKRSILIHPDFVQMAHGVEDVAARVRTVATLSEALADCTASVGFTARKRGHEPLADWRAVRDGVSARAVDARERLALVFGSEEGGLSKEECAVLQDLVRMPTSDEHTSINLATTVAIVLATIFFSAPAGAPSAEAESRKPLLGQDRDFLVARARTVLGARTTSDAARRDVEEMLERVLRRAPMETRDARAWHLLMNALGDGSTPGDLGLDSN
jgi:TrmH family RNA methyltransferase